MFYRSAFHEITKRIHEPRRFIQVVCGPRQVGKTTLVNQVLKAIKHPGLYSSADGAAAYRANWIRQQWETARSMQKQNPSEKFLLVLDEIQKIGDWSEIVKSEWDADTLNDVPLMIILSGSSRLLIQKGLSESLTGRYELIYQGHWSFAEMRDAFDLNAGEFAWYGGFPGSAGIMSQESRWKHYITDSIIETSISKDILMLTRVDKPALLRRLFDIGCTYSGQVISYTKILGQLTDAGNTTTLSHYLDLLSQAGLITGLPKYSGSQVRRRASSPKLQVCNTALTSARRNETFSGITSNPVKWGHVVESAIGAHLFNSSLTREFDLFYWKESNDEVDFVIENEGRVIGLEITTSKKHKHTGMHTFLSAFPDAKTLLIGPGGFPWEKFLETDPGSLF